MESQLDSNLFVTLPTWNGVPSLLYVKCGRIVKDRIRLWEQGVRDLVMEVCCALHNFRVRLNPWLPMI